MHAGKTCLLCPPRRTDWNPVVSGMGRAGDMVMRRLEQQKGQADPGLELQTQEAGTKGVSKRRRKRDGGNGGRVNGGLRA